ncbi:MAG: c-type cytochrome [Sphingomonadaceae bacterium]|nr:c-type cytochrome [Sphingomonadaceae bacterium]
MKLAAAPAAALGLLGCAAVAGAPDNTANARGERAFQHCYACHSVALGEEGLTGPNLAGIVGRPIAAMPGFAYSEELRALAAREERWSETLLDAFITDPEAVAPGNDMLFNGIADPAERAELIAYLRAN